MILAISFTIILYFCKYLRDSLCEELQTTKCDKNGNDFYVPETLIIKIINDRGKMADRKITIDLIHILFSVNIVVKIIEFVNVLQSINQISILSIL